MMVASPGRHCPLHYRYRPQSLAALPERDAGTLYVVGGLYGNLPALDALEGLLAAEREPATVVFSSELILALGGSGSCSPIAPSVPCPSLSQGIWSTLTGSTPVRSS